LERNYPIALFKAKEDPFFIAIEKLRKRKRCLPLDFVNQVRVVYLALSPLASLIVS